MITNNLEILETVCPKLNWTQQGQSLLVAICS